MDLLHGPLCGPDPWSTLGDPPLIFEDDFYQSRVVAKEMSLGLKRKWKQQKEGGLVLFLPTLGEVWVFPSVSY